MARRWAKLSKLFHHRSTRASRAPSACGRREGTPRRAPALHRRFLYPSAGRSPRSDHPASHFSPGSPTLGHSPAAALPDSSAAASRLARNQSEIRRRCTGIQRSMESRSPTLPATGAGCAGACSACAGRFHSAPPGVSKFFDAPDRSSFRAFLWRFKHAGS